jgi:hypothetical protein
MKRREEGEGGADRWDPSVSGCGKKKRRRGGGPLRELGRWVGGPAGLKGRSEILFSFFIFFFKHK